MAILIEYMLEETVFWRLGSADPGLWSLGHVGDDDAEWSLINPLAYRRIGVELGRLSPGFGDVLGIDGDEALVVSRSFILAGPDDLLGHGPSCSSGRFLDFARWLRHAAGGAPRGSLDRVMATSKLGTVDRAVEAAVPVSGPETRRLVYGADMEAALTGNHVEFAAAKAAEGPPPSWATVGLDAVRALDARDYRTALLYAAVAVEAGAKDRLRGLMERVPTADQRFRVVSRDRGGVPKTQDPVFEFLVGTRGAALERLFDEASLYVRGRSLRDEDPPLFQRLRRLAQTRNDIAHRGAAERNNSLTMDASGAAEAVATLRDLWNWLEIPAPLALPSRGRDLHAPEPEWYRGYLRGD